MGQPQEDGADLAPDAAPTNPDELLKAEIALRVQKALGPYPVIPLIAARAALQAIHAEFPLPASGTDETFKATHTLTLDENGQFKLTVWANGKAWGAVLTDDEAATPIGATASDQPK